MSMDFVMGKKQRGEEMIAKAAWLADPSSSMRHVIPMAIATLVNYLSSPTLHADSSTKAKIVRDATTSSTERQCQLQRRLATPVNE